MSAPTQAQTKQHAHGFPVLHHEDRHEYNQLLATYRSDWNPRNAHEDFLVELMVQSRWNLARVQRQTAALVREMVRADKEHRNTDQVIAHAMFTGTAKPYLQLQRAAAAAERSYHRANKELDNCRKLNPLPPPPIEVDFVPERPAPIRIAPQSSTPLEQPQQERPHHAEQNTRHHREIENRPLAAQHNVSGQPARPESKVDRQA